MSSASIKQTDVTVRKRVSVYPLPSPPTLWGSGTMLGPFVVGQELRYLVKCLCKAEQATRPFPSA